MRVGAWENRRFHNRVVRYLAAQAEVRQFLDIGYSCSEQLAIIEAANAVVERREGKARLRANAEIERFFDGRPAFPENITRPISLMPYRLDRFTLAP